MTSKRPCWRSASGICLPSSAERSGERRTVLAGMFIPRAHGGRGRSLEGGWKPIHSKPPRLAVHLSPSGGAGVTNRRFERSIPSRVFKRRRTTERSRTLASLTLLSE
eukprot:Amastigsp_a855185_10.p4 type:complete len:107 gc:universal Amastigsp_a855185_10:765-1085(+)